MRPGKRDREPPQLGDDALHALESLASDYVPYVPRRKRLDEESAEVVAARLAQLRSGHGGSAPAAPMMPPARPAGRFEASDPRAHSTSGAAAAASSSSLQGLPPSHGRVSGARARIADEGEEERALRLDVDDDGDDDGGGSRFHDRSRSTALERSEEDDKRPQFQKNVSLLDEMRAFVASKGGFVSEQEKRRTLEQDMLNQAMSMQQKALTAAREHAEGVVYSKPLLSDWEAPRRLRSLTGQQMAILRNKHHVLVEGEDVPPPCPRFVDMRLPPAIFAALTERGIHTPTPIQVQGLPVVLSGRDMIGVAFTGSGKTLVFALPLMLFALQEELRMPLVGGEGPIGILLAPSRELATQTYELCCWLSAVLRSAGQPELRCMLCIGGMDVGEQIDPLRRKGVHVVVATPGRLMDHLEKRRMTLSLCRYICLDEGDRMLDPTRGFEDELRSIFSHFDHQRQTLIFSATMPRKVREFAQSTLVAPITVNTGRAGAANMDVIQEVEYVKEEARMLYLLECLQKTAPPVMIFSSRSKDVDDITQYLLLKGVGVCSIHGGKEQSERHDAVRQFRAGEKDVLVATDIAAKGLDFPGVQHVINFDMPEAIENYVHRIGRTGRGGKTGLATTFINKSVAELLLLDLKHLLQEAKQRVPPALLALDDPTETVEVDEKGRPMTCSYCGGTHSIARCPHLQREIRARSGKYRDTLRGSD